MNVSGKKLLLIGFIAILLVGIPLTVYILQQQTNTQQHAQASTNLAFSPDSTATNPIQKNVGDPIPLDITVDPGKNLVDFVKIEIQYDPSVLSATGSAFQPNTAAFPEVLDGPVYTPGKIAVSLSVGSDPTKAIQQKVTAGTITFKALKNTPSGSPTVVSFTTNTQVLSVGPSDQAEENVLSSATPANIAIGGSASVSPTVPIPSGTITPTDTGVPSGTPTDTPVPTDTPAATPTSTASNGSPTCTSLTTDVGNSGTAPLTATFTAVGTASNSSTISKASFNFGDGQVSDVTQSGGIGTASVNVQASHTYSTPGTYQASATLTDSSNNVSSGGCTQTITVNAAGATTTPGATAGNPSPTMPPTGSTGITVGIGIGAMLLILGGGLLFFVL